MEDLWLHSHTKWVGDSSSTVPLLCMLSESRRTWLPRFVVNSLTGLLMNTVYQSLYTVAKHVHWRE